MIEARALGRTGLTVSRLGFGGAAIGIEGYLVSERRDDDAVQARARAALEAALAEGVTLFDTAPGYGFGRSERLLGEVLAPHRDRIVLATKVKVEPGQSPDDWTRSVAGSLERLGTDSVDLLQLHGMSWSDRLAGWVLDHAVIDWLESIRARGWTKVDRHHRRSAIGRPGAPDRHWPLRRPADGLQHHLPGRVRLPAGALRSNPTSARAWHGHPEHAGRDIGRLAQAAAVPNFLISTPNA